MRQFAFVLSALFLLPACEGRGSEVSTLKAEIESLRSQVSEISDFKKKADELQASIEIIDMQLEGYQKGMAPPTAGLDPSSKAYQIIRTSHGPLSVAVQDVVPYLNGFKVKLKIGNPSNAKFGNISITADWSLTCYLDDLNVPIGSTEFEQCQSQRRKVLLPVEELQAGTTTTLEIILDDIKTEQIKHTYVSVQIGSMSLLVR